MADAKEWQDKVVMGKKYRIKTRFDDEVVEFMGIGAIGSERHDPVWRGPGTATGMNPKFAV